MSDGRGKEAKKPDFDEKKKDIELTAMGLETVLTSKKVSFKAIELIANVWIVR